MSSRSPVFPDWRRWAGETVAVLASGPSMTQEDADWCRGQARVITVNSTWRLAPWADVHYSSDPPWWREEIDAMRAKCRGEFWTGDADYAPEGMHRCPYDKKVAGISARPGVIGWGGNSGFCALGLAFQFGAARIVMLGFDQSGGHWHGDHPEGVRRPANWSLWRGHFARAALDFKRLGVEVINCSRETTLRCFALKPLREVLC
jgi:hypothetical protein